ncbi:MAG: precorrin-8X methylmutase [bacterium]
MSDRLYDPEEITRRSYEYVDRHLDFETDSSLHRKVARRVVHSTGDFDLAGDLWFSEGLVSALRTVLQSSLLIVTDVTMVESGIRTSLLEKAGLTTDCFVHDPRAKDRAKNEGLTRSAAGLDLALQEYSSFMLVVGNAPTVLFRLLDRDDITPDRIPMVVGAPVGFISVEESKAELKSSDFISVGVSGNRGGSPVAASITNALIKARTGENND